MVEKIFEHPINKSEKFRVMVSVWDFGNKHPQKERWYYKCNDHPAKMRPALPGAILQVYGDSPVLDPMADIGTTLVEAILLARAYDNAGNSIVEDNNGQYYTYTVVPEFP